MPKGESGRVVVEIDPVLKRRLYSALALDSCTLKDWFTKSANDFLDKQTASAVRKTSTGGSKK